MRIFLLVASIFPLFIHFIDAQIVSMFGNAVQAENCAEWGDWGPCIWLKGDNPRWQRSYFDQLLPGRKGCRGHVFFKLLRERWGEAFLNVVEYLRKITLTERQCGFCSFQQSCGRKCSRQGDIGSINSLFVAEKRCEEVDQSNYCEFSPVEQNCNFWPNPSIPLPNVSDSMVHLVNNIQFLNCIPHKNSATGDQKCRCCCAPYAPNPKANFRCEIAIYNGTELGPN